RKCSGVAPAGAGPCPQSTLGVGSSAVAMIAGRSPPGPFRCGSTSCSTKPPATAASKALPPCSRIAMAVCDAIQCVLETMPNVPVSVGRVVKLVMLTSHHCRDDRGGEEQGQCDQDDEAPRPGRHQAAFSGSGSVGPYWTLNQLPGSRCSRTRMSLVRMT